MINLVHPDDGALASRVEDSSGHGHAEDCVVAEGDGGFVYPRFDLELNFVGPEARAGGVSPDTPNRVGAAALCGGSRSIHFHTGNKPLVKDKPKPKKKKPAPPPKAKENNGAKDGATASETKKGKGGATGAKDAAAASKTKKGKTGAK